jgi:all-trans-retinol 13,14-reductase
VKTAKESYDILGPIIVSDAGLKNTFNKLLPLHAAKKSYYYHMIPEFKCGLAYVCLFVGFNASDEELGFTNQNVHAFLDNDCGEESTLEYFKMNSEELKDATPPLIFISFPSAKVSNIHQLHAFSLFLNAMCKKQSFLDFHFYVESTYTSEILAE